VPVARAEPALDYTTGDYWAFADRRQADVEPRWSTRLDRYLPALGRQDTRLEANMLTLHAIAALADHRGASRHDERIEPLVRALTSFPAYVESLGQVGATVAGDQPHAPGWMPSTLTLNHPQHVALDPKVAEALAYAYRARDTVGLDPALSARIVQVIHAVANSPFYRYPAIRLNQFNWYADLYVLDAQLSGDSRLLRQYRSQLVRFIAGVRRAWPPGSSRNLNSGLGLRYLPFSSGPNDANAISTSEYANLIYSGLIHYDWAIARGMRRLSRADERLLRRWGKRLMFGEWTHAGYLNWDTGLGYKRWHLERYWALSLYGLDALVSVRRLAFAAHQPAWAKYLGDRALDTYERWAARSPHALIPWTMWSVHNEDGTPETDPYLIAARFGARAARVALLGIARHRAVRPPAFYARDPDIQRLAVSTPAYSTAITQPHPSIRYGGLELARLYNARSEPVSGIGGGHRSAFGLDYARGGAVRLDTQPGTRHTNLRRGRMHVLADGRRRAPRGTFARTLTVRAAGRNAWARVSVTHRFTPDSIVVIHRIRPRAGGTVTVRLPAWGRRARVRALRADRRLPIGAGLPVRGLSGLRIAAERGGYVVRFDALPDGATVRLLRVRQQASSPHTRTVAVIRFTARARRTATVRITLVPFA
jgi:hypothetical protein